MLTVDQLRQKYLNFFVKRHHKVIPSDSLIQIDGVTTSLFTVAGMQQLISYLKGKKHPMGNRLVNIQPCLRVGDIDIIGDSYHTTFFEMLGNWSLGDYSKEDQLNWFFQFLTQELKLDPNKLYVSVFSGNKNIPQDKESIEVWQKIFNTKTPPSLEKNGFDPSIKIYSYGFNKNWWSCSGSLEKMPSGEIGGPDSEIFYDFGSDLGLHEKSPYKNDRCHLNCDCGRFLEIGNSVFIEYQKQKDGSFSPLTQKNIDFGGGLERLLATLENQPDIFKTSIFYPFIKQLEKETGKKYSEHQQDMRIIVDHLRAVTFLMAEGLEPGNKQQGYVLRRLFRRAMVNLKRLSPDIQVNRVFKKICEQMFYQYKDLYFSSSVSQVNSLIEAEIVRFEKSLNLGLREFNKAEVSKLNSKFAFNLYQTYGFPVEITQELFQQKKQELNMNEFKKIKQQHQQLSRTASVGMFKGGLVDRQEETIKLHTATHLLHQALRDILGDGVVQSGSNITPERARFDFTYNQALTEGQIQQVEESINKQVELKLPVVFKTASSDQAIKQGALAFFKHKYPEKVTVYSVGNFSQEICGGPHVKNTAEIGNIKIYKQKSLGQGLRRLYLKTI